MPKVHYVKKARKDNPAVKAGEPYYWWKFRYGGMRYSATHPKYSQLTQSEFLSTAYALGENIEDELSEDDAQEIVDALYDLQDMAQSSLDNMPDALQDSSDSGQLLQDRVSMCDEWISEIENIDWEETSPEEAATIIRDSEPAWE